jgi:hypothetical protein
MNTRICTFSAAAGTVLLMVMVLARSGALLASPPVNRGTAVGPAAPDAFSQKAKLTVSGMPTDSYFGQAVAMSDDGNTIVVGASGEANAAYVFVKPANGWLTTGSYTAKLTAQDADEDDSLGDSVAITADGNVIVVGAGGADENGQPDVGSAYVYVKPQTGWTNMTNTAKLTASDGKAGDHLGSDVDISDDGTTVVVGATGVDLVGYENKGAMYVFVRPESGWMNMADTARLRHFPGGSDDGLGRSVAVNANGSVAAGGAWRQDIAGDAERGAAYVFVRPGGGWKDTRFPAARLTAAGARPHDRLGVALDMSSDGNTIAVGAHQFQVGSNMKQGMVHVFVKVDASWDDMTSTALLYSSGGEENDLLGVSVAISPNGQHIFAGAIGDDLGRGGAYAFTRSGGGWATTSNYTAKLQALDGVNHDFFGADVAAQSNGNRFVAGAMYNNDDRGAAYIFEMAAPAPTVTPVPCQGKPAKPTLKAPINNAQVGTAQPRLKWNAAACAASYRVMVKNAATRAVVFSANGLDVLKKKTDPLPTGTLLRWTVKACNGAGCRKSEVRFMTVQ